MITPATYYEITCDRCGQRLELDGITAWDKESVSDIISTCGWEELPSGSVICNSCLLTDKINEK